MKPGLRHQRKIQTFCLNYGSEKGIMKEGPLEYINPLTNTKDVLTVVCNATVGDLKKGRILSVNSIGLHWVDCQGYIILYNDLTFPLNWSPSEVLERIIKD